MGRIPNAGERVRNDLRDAVILPPPRVFFVPHPNWQKTERAELDRLRGNAESARSALVLAQRLFAEMGATGYAVRIGKGLAR